MHAGRIRVLVHASDCPGHEKEAVDSCKASLLQPVSAGGRRWEQAMDAHTLMTASYSIHDHQPLNDPRRGKSGASGEGLKQ